MMKRKEEIEMQQKTDLPLYNPFPPVRVAGHAFIPVTAQSLKTAFRDHLAPPGTPSLPLSTG
jgi:hypothetical protein